MKLSYLSLIGALLISLPSCENFSFLPKSTEEKNEESKKVNNGVRVTYRDDGELYSEVSVKNGIKNGIAKSYYEDGSLYLVLNYKDGEKDSTSAMYYKTGELKRTTDYSQGEMHGKRTLYFKNGNLSSESYFDEGRPSIDLVELYKSGKKIKKPQIKIKTQDYTKVNGKYSMEVYFEGKPKKSEFYIGELRDGKFFDSNILERIPGNGRVSTLNGTLPPGAFIMRKIPIVGKMKTVKGNVLIQTTTYNLAIGS